MKEKEFLEKYKLKKMEKLSHITLVNENNVAIIRHHKIKQYLFIRFSMKLEFFQELLEVVNEWKQS